jgi:hypothetical protein
MVGAERERGLQAQQDVEALSLQIDDPAEIALSSTSTAPCSISPQRQEMRRRRLG